MLEDLSLFLNHVCNENWIVDNSKSVKLLLKAEPCLQTKCQHRVDSVDISVWSPFLYKILRELGDGSCGNVYEARDMTTYEIVAVKKLKKKFYFWEEYTNLREIKSLCKMNHSNIIKLKEVVRENNELFLIFEYMDYNLYQLIKERERPFSEEEIRCFMTQVLQGLSHMHKKGFFHRDLKPENLLVTNDVLKIADFGLAREVSSMPPYTQYVSTRWYRAPEVLLQSPYYTPAVDMWAVGAILAELFTLSPIFPGESELDQLYKIYCVLGRPDLTAFAIGANNARLFDFVGHEVFPPMKLSDIIQNASLDAIDLITQLLSWDPTRRPDADQSLQHPFFHVRVPRPLHDPLELRLSSKRTKPNLELKLQDFGPDTNDCFLGLTLAVNPSASNLDVVHNVSKGMGEDLLLCSDFNHHPDQSIFWSLLSPDQSGIHTPAETSLSLTFGSIQHPPTGVPQSAGFSSFQPLQPNILTSPFLALSSPFQRGHCLSD